MLPVVYHPDYTAPLDTGHRFPMGKYDRLCAVLVADGLVSREALLHPEPAPVTLVEAAHDPAYVAGVIEGTLDKAAVRRIGLPNTERVARRSRLACAGTLLTARLAFQHGAACNTAGGSHHAARGHGAGFSVFNDVAVAAYALLAEGAVGRVLVVDLDVHQGDGTAEIFAGDMRVFTFSMHGEKNFPVRKQASDLDVGLPDGMEDDAYLAVLEDHLGPMLEHVRPDIVFYNAGVDPHKEDRLGRLALSDEGLKARDRMVVEACLSRGVPLAGVIGGGYSHDVDALARRHAFLHHSVAAGLRQHG